MARRTHAREYDFHKTVKWSIYIPLLMVFISTMAFEFVYSCFDKQNIFYSFQKKFDCSVKFIKCIKLFNDKTIHSWVKNYPNKNR